MDKILFSIIVPCYNVQEYLQKCIESILEQTYENYEVILIDDGSNDMTPALCDKFGDMNSKIRVFHKKNGGLSDARNFGIERALGDYFVFVDGDDWIEANALDHFSDILDITHPDVLLTQLTEYYGDNDIIEKDGNIQDFFKDGITRDNALIWEMKESKYTWPAQKKILSNEFIEKNHLRFLNGYLHEDIDWSTKVMMYAKTFAVYSETWYYHRMQREGSITNTVSSKRITDVIEIVSALISERDMQLLTNERRELIIDRLMCSVYPILTNFGHLSSVGKEEVIKCCNSNRWIFQIAPTTKYKLFSLMIRIFGFRISLNLLGCFGEKL